MNCLSPRRPPLGGPYRRGTPGSVVGRLALALMTAADLARPATLSRESSGVRYRWTVRAEHLNAWCRIPGNPFISPLVLMANPPGFGDVRVEFGPVTLPDGFDTFTVFLRSAGRPPHAHLLRATVEVLDGSGEGLDGSTHDLASGKAATA